jgi:hypothetical protein
MAASKSFRDVIVWQKAHAWVLEVYRLTRRFPKEETYSLTAQPRRAAVSVPANIAERFAKSGKGDKLRFYNISQAPSKNAATTSSWRMIWGTRTRPISSQASKRSAGYCKRTWKPCAAPASADASLLSTGY